jgi:Putative DNA-binding domain
MRTLEDLQSGFAKAVLGGDASGIAGELSVKNADPLARLQIYRNNTSISLTNALIANFPVTVRLVDERFFRYAADTFIRHHPPREARLCEYGADLPGFLRTFPPCRDVRFVADVAELEWAMTRAALTGEAEALEVGVLRGGICEPETAALDLQPSLRFVVTRWPAFEIWQSQQPGGGSAAVDMTPGLRRYSVSRMGQSVHVNELSSADFAFRRALSLGGTIEAAVRRALRRDPMFDLVVALVTLFREGLVVGLRDGATAVSQPAAT